MRKRLTVIVMICAMLFSWAQAAAIYGSLPDDGVYVEQDQKHTCTLVAATMMLRNFAFQCGYDYNEIGVADMRKVCWSDYGLAQRFDVGSVSVTHNTDISSAQDKKMYLIEQLIAHPEGLVIYNSRQPHAIFLFGYRADTDTFFCADTTGTNSLRVITMEESLLDGNGQQGKIDGLTKIWHIDG